MTNDPPPSPTEPEPVDDHDELLSALVDGELEQDQLVDLEQFAVDTDTTIDQLSRPFERVGRALAESLVQPAPDALRARHIAAALDAMDAPEVASLAAARAQSRAAEQARAGERERFQRSQRLNVRLRRLSAVAAAVAVFGGIGLFALQADRSGEDSALTEAAGDDAAAGGEATFEDQARDASATTTTMAGLAQNGGDDASDGAVPEDDSMSEASAADLSGANSVEPLSLPLDLDLATIDATSVDALYENAVPATTSPESVSAEASPAAFECVEQAAIDAGDDAILRSLTALQGDDLYELVILETDEVLVYRLPTCERVA